MNISTRISLLFSCCLLIISCAKEAVRGANDDLSDSQISNPQTDADASPESVEAPSSPDGSENVIANPPTEVIDEVGAVIPLEKGIADPLTPSDDSPVEDPVDAAENSPESIEEVNVTCENAIVVEQSFQVNFMDTKALDNKDNCKNRPVLADMRPELNGVINAYTIESQKFSLPPNTILCGLDIKQVNNENFYYDDHVFLLLNRNILMSSYPYHIERGFSQLEGDYRYDIFQFEWDKLQEAPQHDDLKADYPEYCLGTDGDPALDEATSCVVPTSQDTGLFNLKLADSLTQELYFHAKDSKVFDFELVTTGDDNTSRDCRHSALNMEVSVKYVTLPSAVDDPVGMPKPGKGKGRDKM